MAALVRQGLIPCAPITPTLAFPVRVLELYRTNHLRCPRLAITPFVKGLCDLHGITFQPYLSQQFSISYDLYLAVRESVANHVRRELGRDGAYWRIQHTCPACTYKLKGEADLIFSMLLTMDGNDSLKRILRREPAPEPTGQEKEGDEPATGASRESKDSRVAGGDYYLTREQVDKWAKEVLEDMLAIGDDSVSFLPTPSLSQPTSPSGN